MSTMFIIGLIIFLLYICSLLYMINMAHKSQEEEISKDPEIPNKFK